MRNIVTTLIIVLGLTSLYAQDVKLSASVKEMPNSKMIFNDGETLIYFGTSSYSKVNLENGEIEKVEIQVIEHDNRKWYSVKRFVHEDEIIELVFSQETPSDTIFRLGLVKKDLDDLSDVSDIEPVGDFVLYSTGRNFSFNLYPTKNGFYLTGDCGKKVNCIFNKYDYDLNELWSHKVPFISEEGVTISRLTIDDKGDLLVAVSIEDIQKQKFWSFKTPVRSSGLMFLHFSHDGDLTSVSPEFNQSLFVKMYEFKYYPELERLVGVFIITDMINEDKRETAGIGYAYMTWNLEGELLSSEVDFLEYNDLASDEMEEYYKKSKLKRSVLESERGLPTVNNPYKFNYEFIFDEKGGVLVVFKKFQATRGLNDDAYRELVCSKLIFQVDSQGERQWTNFYPYYSNNVNWFSKYYVSNGQLHMFTKEFSANFKGEDYSLNTIGGRAGWEGLILAERVIDCSSGELVSFKPVLDSPIENFMISSNSNFIEATTSPAIFEYEYARKKMKKYLIIKY